MTETERSDPARRDGDDPVAGSGDDPFRDEFAAARTSEDDDALSRAFGWEDGRGTTRSERRRALAASTGGSRPRRRGRAVRAIIAVVVILAVFGAAGAFVWVQFRPQVEAVQSLLGGHDENPDYSGSGTGTVRVTILSGQTGSDIGATLKKAGVVESVGAFYQAVVATKPDPVFQPGVYQLRHRMSAEAALERLQDPDARLANTAVITEGQGQAAILPLLAQATKVPLADLTAAAADPTAYGLPAGARNLDGFLFPATYSFDPGTSAHDVIKTLVDRSFQAYDQAGVAPADRFRVATLASIVQKEAGSTDDMPKVSRVFTNRLDAGMPLQSDATVAYGAGVQRVFTTDQERADASNPYNTYAHAGLPVGPIGNPGDAAIDAALHPVPGPWLYFVTVNLRTGETVFSATAAEHEAAVAQLQAWCKQSAANEALCR